MFFQGCIAHLAWVTTYYTYIRRECKTITINFPRQFVELEQELPKDFKFDNNNMGKV